MSHAFICDALRTPFGRYGGALASIRTDDLAALPIAELMKRHPSVDWAALDDVVLGCVNQAGEDNRNVARMAALLAGLPEQVPGTTVNRLCGSSLEAILVAARAIGSGEMDLVMAGGVESMSRAPFVMPKADAAFSRAARVEDTTMGWRFVNPRMQSSYGVDTMPDTAENVAAAYGIARADQDAFAFRSQQRADRGGAGRLLRGGDRSRCDSGKEGGRYRRLERRAPTAGHDARGAGRAQADRQAGRDRHGRQRVGRERWRRRRADRVGARRRSATG